MRIGGGLSTTASSQGLGVSWGIGGVRLGRSPTGRYWVSLSIPGTGIGFFQYLDKNKQQLPVHKTPLNSSTTPSSTSLTNNQRLLVEIKKTKP